MKSSATRPERLMWMSWAGAAIDVFDSEPPVSKEEPLVNAPNTVLTPHVAFATKESMIKRAVIEFDNIAGFINNN